MSLSPAQSGAATIEQIIPAGVVEDGLENRGILAHKLGRRAWPGPFGPDDHVDSHLERPGRTGRWRAAGVRRAHHRPHEPVGQTRNRKIDLYRPGDWPLRRSGITPLGRGTRHLIASRDALAGGGNTHSKHQTNTLKKMIMGTMITFLLERQ